MILAGDEVTRWWFDPRTRSELRHWVSALNNHPTRKSLERSDAWIALREPLRRLLETIHQGAPGEGPVKRNTARSGGDPSRDRTASAGMQGPPLRFVHWNILKGVCFDDLVGALVTHPELAGADVVMLNEVDIGMARSGNRHVAAELGAALDCHWIWAPSYLELTKGVGRDVEAGGENEIGMQGVAVLSRRPVLAARLARLPECFDMYAYPEKRFGSRVGLLAALDRGLAIGTTHLEVRAGGRCRAKQMTAFINEVERFSEMQAAAGQEVKTFVLSGDLNTHTFARHALVRALIGSLRICLTPDSILHAQLMEPWQANREPLFAELRRAAFEWEPLNDRFPTASERLGNVEEWRLVPSRLRPLLRRILRLENRTLALRLDWFAARGDWSDPPRACTITSLRHGDVPSDHDPLVLVLRPAG